ncbi:Canalicular multispecific organic anion transporter 2 [Irineochytrium annulatum]|nr:Canalicular multispecific organic anion transporter 2 [Irineochytrium annulatum]
MSTDTLGNVAVDTVVVENGVDMTWLKSKGGPTQDAAVVVVDDFKKDRADLSCEDVISWNFFNFSTIGWIFPLLQMGFKKPLLEEDLPRLGKDYKAEDNTTWLDSVSGVTKGPKKTLAQALTPHLLLPLVAISFLTLINVAATIFVSLMIGELIDYLSGAEHVFIKNGVGIAFILFGLQMAKTLSDNLSTSITNVVGVRIKAAIITAVYRKSLKISSKLRQNFPPGKINTFVGSDANRIASFISTVNTLWSAPVQFVVSLYFIARLLKYATFVSVGVFLAATFLAMAMMRNIGNHYGAYYMWLDERTTALREFLYGVKVVKYQAIEQHVEKKIKDAREPQIKALISLAFIFMFEVGAQILQGQLMSTLTLVSFAAMGNSFDSATVFPAISFLSTLISVSDSVTSIYQSFIQCGVSYKRLSEFFTADEAAEDEAIARASCSDAVNAVQLTNASFVWEAKEDGDDEGEEGKSSTFALKDVTLEMKKGTLVAIVGAIGSGKSSLLSAIAGSMRKTRGTATVDGSVGYCPQEPWIISGTIEDNITLLDPSVTPAVASAINLCSLDTDLKSFPLGAKTFIGEQGVNLSGGQKARIALARAIARDADVYILDDPLSALDAHISKSVLNRAIKSLVLRGKTVILATHLLHVLRVADHVVVMHEGNVVQSGGYTDLMGDAEGKLAEIMKDHQGGDDEVLQEETAEEEKKEDQKEEETEEGKEEKEDRATGIVSLKTYISFLKASGAHWVITLAVAFIVAVGFGSIQQLTLSFWTDNYFGYDNQNKYLYMYLGFGLIVTVADFFTLAAALFMVIRAGRSLHDNALTGLLTAPMSFYDSQPIGRILNRMTNDVADFDTNTAVSLSVIFFTASGIMTVIVTIIVTAPYVSFIILFLVATTLAIFSFFKPSYRELKRLAAIMKSPLSSHISETLTGVPTILAYDAKPTFHRRLLATVDKANLATMLVTHAQLWFYLRIDMLGCLLTLVVGLFGVTNVMRPVFAGLAVTLSIGFSGQLKSFLSSVAVIEGDMVAVERLNYYAEKLPAEAPRFLPSDEDLKPWPTAGAIAIKSLKVRYDSRPEHLILRGVSIDIKGGEKVGIVGRTGSGKSTFMDCFFRLTEPSEGSIAIDGKDIAQIGLDKLRRNVAMVPQNPTLFEGTLRFNVDTLSRFDDDKIWKAIESVGLKAFVSELKDKLEYSITEGGTNLSAGQRQLLVLARILLNECKVVIMDEATSSVDQESDRRIQELLRSDVFADRTVLSVAHRLNTVASADRVMVLDEGRVVEFDTPAVLLATEGSAFRRLVEATGEANAAAIAAVAGSR